MRRSNVVLLVVMAMTAVSGLACAGGSGAYPNGAEDMFSGMVPPPGCYFLDYNYFYSADKFSDLAGGAMEPDAFDGFVYGNIPRFLYVSKMQVCGAQLATHLFVPIMHLNAKIDGLPTDFFDVNETGLGDIIYDPLILAWHSKTWHMVVACDIYLPTGQYDKEQFANIGKNLWTFEPILALTYNHPCGWSASAKMMYDISTKNSDYVAGPGAPEADLQPGDEFHFDYALNKEVCKDTQLGVAGYCYWQLNDDEIDGIKVDTDKSQVYALGPVASYKCGPWSVTAKGAWEFEAKNHTEGFMGQLKLVRAFGGPAPQEEEAGCK